MTPEFANFRSRRLFMELSTLDPQLVAAVRKAQVDEKLGAATYSFMARREKNAENRRILEQMSLDETRHAAVWQGILKENLKYSSVTLLWIKILTVVLGFTFVVKTLQKDEKLAQASYEYDKSWGEYENWNNNTDWVGAVTQFGPQHEFDVNLTGGGQKATFRISAGYKNQTGSIIKQKLQQFTTRMVLDYNVSDRIRFSTNFALAYTDNLQNYEGSINGVSHSSLLSIAQQMAPNMSIFRQNADGSDTDEYYTMSPSGNAMTGNYSSTQLSAIRSLGNPVAIANLAWKKEQTYRLTPDFSLKYELLGIEPETSRLTLDGRVDFDIYADSKPTYFHASLKNDTWTNSEYNLSTNAESNRFKVGGRVDLTFTPYFKNPDFSLTMLARYELSTQKYNYQYVVMNELPSGITSPTVDAALSSMTSSNSRSNSQDWLFNSHFAYKDGRYSLNFSLRADGDSKFGPKNKWAYFPGVALRYNII